MSKKTVGVFVGSLRKDSFNKKIAQYVIDLMPNEIAAKIISIGDLELYNEDLDNAAALPASWARFRNEASQVDAFLFVTPEYNRSVPAALKNALDVGSRPYGKSVWDAKPGAIISASPGKVSAFGANHHLRQSMVFLNVYMMQQPEAYLGNIADDFGPDGNLNSEHTKSFLKNYADAFAAWINRF